MFACMHTTETLSRCWNGALLKKLKKAWSNCSRKQFFWKIVSFLLWRLNKQLPLVRVNTIFEGKGSFHKKRHGVCCQHCLQNPFSLQGVSSRTSQSVHQRTKGMFAMPPLLTTCQAYPFECSNCRALWSEKADRRDSFADLVKETFYLQCRQCNPFTSWRQSVLTLRTKLSNQKKSFMKR